MNLLALIPAYNEAGHITPVIHQSLTHLPVLVVDDGSIDQTAAEAESAGATVLRQLPNQGKGAALRAGFRWALERDYAAVITLDADGQHDPAELPAFIEAYRANSADLIIGTRQFRHMPPVRRIANLTGLALFSWALGQRIHDNQSGYRLISRRLMETMLASQEGGFEFEVDMIITAIRHHFPIAWVPIRTIYTGGGSHIRPWHHTVNFLRLTFKARQSLKHKE
jgi:glycosyltransferase involved in cell wall biosynthesis